VDATPLAVTCPRCGAAVEQRFYGPCAGCVAELRTKYDAVAREVEAVEYVPQMNVTPNAVATKE
jgi:NMD protein affecting ribosome stability and mRNA decay